ncbi:MAG: sugar phosphate isomerase/epimerase [Phycisphaeraceae bacterium]|jgi:sugar phosphate isomerase/epimerase|nr:sugar phosphate isomerase/epimerase [Phycisphaeraceae bacterium]
MPLALSISALHSKLMPPKGGRAMLLTDVPRYVRDEMGLAGLLLTTDVLAGADRARLMQILECADKASCPVLGLSEVKPMDLASEDDRVGDAAIERCMRVAQAAHWMGCSAFSIPIQAPDTDEALDIIADRLKLVARRSEKLDLNLAIAPGRGLTTKAERVGELLKRIGGFRIGTLPDFATAALDADPIAYLRRLVPYASIVLATGTKFESPVQMGKGGTKGAGKGVGKGKQPEPDAAVLTPGQRAAGLVHTPYDIGQMVAVLIAVGFEGPIAIDYRGEGDPVAPILHIKGILDRFLSTGVDEDILEGLDDLPELPADDDEKV